MGILDRFRKKSSNLGTAQPEKPSAPVQPKTSVLGSSNGVLSSSDSATSGTIQRSGQGSGPDESNTSTATSPSALGKPSHTRTNLNIGLNTNLGTGVGRDDDVLGLSKRVEGGDPPIRITIMNGKGGSGKSTITTNLATVLTTHPNSVTIIDNDPQASSIRWLR
ncbi:MAG: ParA family protein, partial [Gammaproteobacteria bacterium]|nr:ParA family protein [Gammaproteobacteria bacterium]